MNGLTEGRVLRLSLPATNRAANRSNFDRSVPDAFTRATRRGSRQRVRQMAKSGSDTGSTIAIKTYPKQFLKKNIHGGYFSTL